MADRNTGRNAFERHRIAVEEAKQQIMVRVFIYNKHKCFRIAKIFYLLDTWKVQNISNVQSYCRHIFRSLRNIPFEMVYTNDKCLHKLSVYDLLLWTNFVPIVVTTNLTPIRNSLGIGYFSLACKYNNYNNSHLLYCKCTSS